MSDDSGASRPDLLTRAQRGDLEAMGALYDQHHEALFRYIWSRVRDRPLAEDLTGEVFLRMLAALPRYRPSQAPFRAWLYRVAHNLLVDHYRKESQRVEVPLDQAPAQDDQAVDPGVGIEHNLTLERVHRALARLDQTQREVVSLRFLSGLSLQEVAAALHKSENAVKALQHRGLSALRRALSQEQVLP